MLTSNVYVHERQSYSGVGTRQLEEVMNTGRARVSLAELRSRTDQQLHVLLRNEIERAMRCARRNAVAEAEARLAQSWSLLAMLRKSGGDCAELEGRIAEVRDALGDRGRPYLCAHSACC